MRFRSRVVMLAAVGGLTACAVIAKLDPADTLDGGATEGDGGEVVSRSPTDATTPARDGAASASDTGVGPTDAGTDTGTDAGAKFQCPATGGSVADCSACAGNPLACVLCGGSGPRMFCTSGRVCNDSQIVSHWCPCSGTNPAACPFERQTCYGGICLTCGEQNSTNMYKCHNGSTCTAASYSCQ